MEFSQFLDIITVCGSVVAVCITAIALCTAYILCMKTLFGFNGDR